MLIGTKLILTQLKQANPNESKHILSQNAQLNRIEPIQTKCNPTNQNIKYLTQQTET